jgi:antitoxin (DNA-binding transcriptional repressor) of toxin-antitoxin stability system
LQRPVYKLVYTSKQELIVNIEVGSYEAKTKLPELLRGIQAGNRYTITLRGEAIADLVPAEENSRSDALAAVDEMLSYMQARKAVGNIDLKALIDEGRA